MKIILKCILILAILLYTNPSKLFMLSGSPNISHPNNVGIYSEINYCPEDFLLAKVELEEEFEEELVEDIAQESPGQKEQEKKQKTTQKPDYGNLQVIPYIILAGEYASLKDEKFKAELYPKRIINIPNGLKLKIKKNMKLVVLGTKKGDNKQYLVIQKDKVSLFKRAIKFGKSVKFVFTPVALYNYCPVIEFIDIL